MDTQTTCYRSESDIVLPNTEGEISCKVVVEIARVQQVPVQVIGGGVVHPISHGGAQKNAAVQCLTQQGVYLCIVRNIVQSVRIHDEKMCDRLCLVQHVETC